jgi:hypothetical protein
MVDNLTFLLGELKTHKQWLPATGESEWNLVDSS